MIDKSLPFYSVVLCKKDTENYPHYSLPEGYSFSLYRAGDEESWAELECSVGQFDSQEKALAGFRDQFVNGQRLKVEERMVFVRNPNGKCVATASLWDGDNFGEILPRFHWLVVSDECVGLGIAKALFTRLFDMYNELGFGGFVYLITATHYYPAIGIYKKFGFDFYRGERSPFGHIDDEKFATQNPKAIELIESKLLEYKKSANA